MPKTQYFNCVGRLFEAIEDQIGREHKHTDAIVCDDECGDLLQIASE